MPYSSFAHLRGCSEYSGTSAWMFQTYDSLLCDYSILCIRHVHPHFHSSGASCGLYVVEYLGIPLSAGLISHPLCFEPSLLYVDLLLLAIYTVSNSLESTLRIKLARSRNVREA